MTIRFNPRWLFVLSLVFSLQLCRAQVEVPPFVNFSLGDTNNPDSMLWDLQGTYSLNLNVVQRNGLVLPVNINFILLQDASGRLSSPTNDNTEALNVSDNSFFAVLPRVTGKVTGSGGTARVQLSIRFAGTGQVSGQPTSRVKGTFSITAETDPTTGNLVGTKNGKFSINISGMGSASGIVNADDFSTPMPNGANATWTLSLQLVGLKKITGDAVITTPNRAIGYDLSGKFNGVFNIACKGVNNIQDTTSGIGSSFKMQIAPTFDSGSFQGKVLGQNLSFTAPADPQPQ
jgi:hypothetical protein